MVSRPILNNVKQYKKRDVSMDHKIVHERKASQNGNQKLPVINVPQKCLKVNAASRPGSKTRGHSRLASFDQRKMSAILTPSMTPKELCLHNLVKDYGHGVDRYLKELELNSVCTSE